MRHKISFLVLMIFVLAVLAACGKDNPAGGGGNSGPGPVSINKFALNGTTITASVNNPFSGQVSAPGFTAASIAVFITIPQSAAISATFTESATLSATPIFNTLQAAGIPAILSGNAAPAFITSANDHLSGEGVFRQSEINIAKQPGLSTQKKMNGLSAWIAPTPVLNASASFWISPDPNNNLPFQQIVATCLYIGPNVNIYVDNVTPASGTVYTAANLAAISAAWDAIYLADTTTFGSEAKPGIDGDSKVTIFISPAVNNYGTNGTLGYFWGKDEWAQTVGKGTAIDYSNQREMFYVIDTPPGVGATSLWADASVNGPNSKEGYAILAHEFQHMINYNQKVLLHYNPAAGTSVFEDTWLNEALSMYAMQACGYGMPQGDVTTVNHVKNYLTAPHNYSLTQWTSANYGISYLFMLYLVEHYGGGVGTPASQTMLKGMESNAFSGIANIESVTGAGMFPTVFKNWAMANIIDKKTTNPLYNYTTINLYGTYGGIVLNGAQSNIGALSQPGWSAMYQIFGTAAAGSNSLNLSATANNTADGMTGILILK